MKHFSLLLVGLCMAASTATAANVEQRSNDMESQLKGNHSYHAELARELSSIANEEVGQHDTQVGQAFMTEAESEAQKAGSK